MLRVQSLVVAVGLGGGDKRKVISGTAAFSGLGRARRKAKPYTPAFSGPWEEAGREESLKGNIPRRSV